MKNIKNIIELKYPPENPNDLWMKDNVLYKSTHKGWTPLTTGGGSSTNGVTSTTWLELKDKRDAGKLIPGSLYRITDYQCTTTQKNTQSAGHQFDIVLLALSENKLAEEGWAMMHDNVYDVTFVDGVTRKCYLYNTDNDEWNIVDVQTLLGIEAAINGYEIIINEESKTVTMTNRGYNSDYLETENLTYNYFQNSNLSAWKVWYSLDNDKSRFAWADDSVDEDELAYVTDKDNTILYRNSAEDTTVYAWTSESNKTLYTESETPRVGDDLLNALGQPDTKYGTVISYTPTHEGTGLPNGRGVIYRLIDEFNNDVAYDFKNVQFLVKINMETGYYDEEGDDTYVYSLNAWIDAVIMDASIIGNTLLNDVGIVDMVANNVIKLYPPREQDAVGYMLPYNIILTSNEDGEGYYGANYIYFDGFTTNNIITSPCINLKLMSHSCENIIAGQSNSIFLACFQMTNAQSDTLYANNKKVLTEE